MKDLSDTAERSFSFWNFTRHGTYCPRNGVYVCYYPNFYSQKTIILYNKREKRRNFQKYVELVEFNRLELIITWNLRFDLA